MKETRIPTRFKFRKRRYLGDKLSAETFIPGSGFLVLLTRDVLRDGASLVTRPEDRVLMIQPLDLLWREFVFEFHVRTSSYLDSFYVLWLLRSPVRCSVTRCLLVTTLSREASLTVATLIVRSRSTRTGTFLHAVHYEEICSVGIIYRSRRPLYHYFHIIIEISFSGAPTRSTAVKINCQANASVQKRYEKHSSSGCLMQNGLNSHAHLRVNLAAIN